MLIPTARTGIDASIKQNKICFHQNTILEQTTRLANNKLSLCLITSTAYILVYIVHVCNEYEVITYFLEFISH